MILHYIAFFVAVLMTLMYAYTFYENRKIRVKLHFFHRMRDMSLGGLMLTVFIDGIILALLIEWLMV